jgi:hypothetical protein
MQISNSEHVTLDVFLEKPSNSEEFMKVEGFVLPGVSLDSIVYKMCTLPSNIKILHWYNVVLNQRLT